MWMWTAKRNVKWGPPIRTCIWNDRAIAIHSTAETADLMTGKPIGAPFRIGTCGGFTVTANYGMGLSGPVVDLASGRALAGFLAKANCTVGNMVAAGTFIQAPNQCSVCNHVYGFLAMRSFPGYDLSRPATDAQRLVSLPGLPPAALVNDPKDWPPGLDDADILVHCLRWETPICRQFECPNRFLATMSLLVSAGLPLFADAPWKRTAHQEQDHETAVLDNVRALHFGRSASSHGRRCR